MDQDRWDIDHEIGHRGAANYTVDAVGVLQTTAHQQVGDLTLMVLTYSITYWRDDS
jgi:hypothetical protein